MPSSVDNGVHHDVALCVLSTCLPASLQVVLVQALFLMARDHPYHTLYPIIALSNGDTEGGDPAAKNAHIRHQTNTARVCRLLVCAVSCCAYH